MKLDELYANGDVFFGKGRKRPPCTADISVRRRSNKGRIHYNIYFRNNVCKKYIFSKMERIGRIISGDGNRLYFVNAGDKTGYKIINNKGETKFADFSDEKLNDFVGDYNLYFDSECGLPYIDKRNKQ